MFDPLSEKFHAWRAQLLATLGVSSSPILRVLAAELRQTASAIDVELRERERVQDAERQDARLYKQRGEP